MQIEFSGMRVIVKLYFNIQIGFAPLSLLMALLNAYSFIWCVFLCALI